MKTTCEQRTELRALLAAAVESDRIAEENGSDRGVGRILTDEQSDLFDHLVDQEVIDDLLDDVDRAEEHTRWYGESIIGGGEMWANERTRAEKAEAEVERLRGWLTKIGDPKRLQSDYIKTTRVWVEQALLGEGL